MTKHRDRKLRTRALQGAGNYTGALRATETPQHKAWPMFKPDMRIKFVGEKQSYTVQAVSQDGRYVVCTRPFNLRRTVYYTVMDLQQGIRGTDDYGGLGYEDRRQCEQAVACFVATDTYNALSESGDIPTDADEYEKWIVAQPGLNDEQGNELLRAEVSHRNWVWIRLAEYQRDPTVAHFSARMREILASAPNRWRNSW
ncbi:hypothetical protein [Mycobacteroides abscessus]|uniref:hypothetical protein n=1 Tax=Mycobacteroides abscessus TaxID=36809 RepID=UPI0009C958C5|nr:hypothetical protein [Mycobacteroides abscessus]SLH38449.1 Uncharacterised protein [Mycobacteroides abscessus subsp. massiliense]